MKDDFHLVTSSLEETWDFSKKNLFAGEWCKLYSRRSQWHELDHFTCNYHWDNRKKYFEDSKYLGFIFKICIESLTQSLNSIHKVNYSQRYWQILIGPWLHKFINILYDKLSTIKLIQMNYNIKSSYIIDLNYSFFVPKDTAEFNTFMLNDIWNHLIFSELQENFFNIDYEKISFSRNYNEINRKFINYSENESIKIRLFKLIDRISNQLSTNHEYFIKSSYLSLYEEIKLNFLLNKFPSFNFNTLSVDSNFDEKIRSKFSIYLKNNSLNDDFIKIVFFMIKRHLPTIFLEGYQLINETLDSQHFPKNPKKIFTSNAFEYDEIFKLYSARKTETGTKLIIGQHGGFYGVSKWNHGEDHLIDIADNFISWGWKSQNNKVYPGFNFTPSLPKKKFSNSSKAIFLTHPVARHNWKSQSWPASASQSNNYMDDHLKFFHYLKDDIRKKFVYRILISSDLENKTSFVEKMNNNLSDIEIDKGKIPLKRVINKYKITCIPYNATNFLQTLSSNFPTVIFWNEKNFELRNEAIPFFEKLKKVNIFHSSPVSAANHINLVWHNIDKWWKNKKTQEAKNDFCINFSKIEEDNVLSLKKIIKTIL